MSETPRTDVAWKKNNGRNPSSAETWASAALDMRRECMIIETELADLKAQFAEYVMAEIKLRKIHTWQEYAEIALLHEKAKQTLGL